MNLRLFWVELLLRRQKRLDRASLKKRLQADVIERMVRAHLAKVSKTDV